MGTMTYITTSAEYLYYLVDVAAQQRAEDRGRLHDQDQVPVDQRLVAVRVPPVRIEDEVRQRAAHDGHVAQRHRVVGLEVCACAGDARDGRSVVVEHTAGLSSARRSSGRRRRSGLSYEIPRLVLSIQISRAEALLSARCINPCLSSRGVLCHLAPDMRQGMPAMRL